VGKKNKSELAVVPFGGWTICEKQFRSCFNTYNSIRKNLGLGTISRADADDHILMYYGTKYQFSKIVDHGFLGEPLLWERELLAPTVLDAVRKEFILEVGQILASRPTAIVPLSREVRDERAINRQQRFRDLFASYGRSVPEWIEKVIQARSQEYKEEKIEDVSYIRFQRRFQATWRNLVIEHNLRRRRSIQRLNSALGGNQARREFIVKLYQSGKTSDADIRAALLDKVGPFLKASLAHEDANTEQVESVRVAEQEAFQQALRNAQPKLRTVQSRSSDKRGFVYVVTSPTFPGWVKIGQTMDLQQRLVAFNTHNPHSDFSFAFYHGFLDRALAEKVIHKFFAKKRGPNGEWFQMSVEEARSAILELSERIEERIAA
jgi:hypothetical protein